MSSDCSVGRLRGMQDGCSLPKGDDVGRWEDSAEGAEEPFVRLFCDEAQTKEEYWKVN